MGDNMNEGIAGLLDLYMEQLGKLETQFNKPEFGTDHYDEFVMQCEARFGAFPCIEELEAMVSVFKIKRDRILNDDIPALFDEYGVSKITRTDGTVVELKQILSVSTPEGAKERMVAWVEAHGGADLVKDTLAFGKGQCSAAVFEFLAEGGYSYTRDQKVESQTLKKFITEIFEAGGEMPPEDTIRAKSYTTAKITAPRK